jgi:predicted site-specific integrase-resolvase
LRTDITPVVGRITSNSKQEDLDWLVKRVVNGAVVDLEKVIKDVNNCLRQPTRECVLIAAAIFVTFGIPNAILST